MVKFNKETHDRLSELENSFAKDKDLVKLEEIKRIIANET